MKHVVGLFLLNVLQDVKCCEKKKEKNSTPSWFLFLYVLNTHWLSSVWEKNIEIRRDLKKTKPSISLGRFGKLLLWLCDFKNRRYYFKMKKMTFQDESIKMGTTHPGNPKKTSTYLQASLPSIKFTCHDSTIRKTLPSMGKERRKPLLIQLIIKACLNITTTHVTSGINQTQSYNIMSTVKQGGGYVKL